MSDAYVRKLEVIQDHGKSVETNYDHVKRTPETYSLISDKPEHQQRPVDWTNWHRRDRPPPASLDEIKRKYIVGSVKQVTEKFVEYINVSVQRFMIYFMD